MFDATMWVFSEQADRPLLEPGTLFDVKPIRWWFILSLPLFAAAIWLVFLTLAAVERCQRDAKLRELVLHGSVEEATYAVRRMGRLSNPPLDLVVAAATSPSGTVAYEGRLAVNDVLRRCRRKISAGRNVGGVARQLSQLAAQLDDRRNTFALRDYAWLAKTAKGIVELANRMTPDKSPGLAVHCDSLLAMANSPIDVAMQPVSRSASQQTSTPTFASAAAGNDSGQAIAVTPVEATKLASNSDGVFAPPPQEALQTIVNADNVLFDDSVVEDVAAVSESRRPDAVWSGQWMRPLLSAVGISPNLTPIGRGEQSPIEFTSPHSAEIAGPTVDMARAEPAGTEPTPVLLQRWLTADAPAVQSIERELARRGFRAMPREFVEMLLADDSRVRVQLVQVVIATPSIDAKPWLLLLSDDSSSDVRLAAVTVMATSSDPQMIDKAWQAALNDHDPRVAALAERIRDRRDSLQRR